MAISAIVLLFLFQLSFSFPFFLLVFFSFPLSLRPLSWCLFPHSFLDFPFFFASWHRSSFSALSLNCRSRVVLLVVVLGAVLFQTPLLLNFIPFLPSSGSCDVTPSCWPFLSLQSTHPQAQPTQIHFVSCCRHCKKISASFGSILNFWMHISRKRKDEETFFYFLFLSSLLLSQLNSHDIVYFNFGINWKAQYNNNKSSGT